MILSQEGGGTACLFTKSGKNHRNLCINIINWKSEKCAKLAYMRKLQEYVPQCSVADDANGLSVCLLHSCIASKYLTMLLNLYL